MRLLLPSRRLLARSNCLPAPKKHQHKSEVCEDERRRIKGCRPGKALQGKQPKYELQARQGVGRSGLSMWMVVRFAEGRGKSDGVSDSNKDDCPKWVTSKAPYGYGQQSNNKEYPVTFCDQNARRLTEPNCCKYEAAQCCNARYPCAWSAALGCLGEEGDCSKQAPYEPGESMGLNFTFQNPLYVKKVAKQSNCDCENAERRLQSLCVHCLIIAFRTGPHGTLWLGHKVWSMVWLSEKFGSDQTLEMQNEALRSLNSANNSWLGRQFWNQTFEDDVEVKIEEIRQLLDVSNDCGGESELLTQSSVVAYEIGVELLAVL